MKRVLAIAALILASAAAVGTPASAAACLTVHVQVNDTVQDVNQCV